jgi:CDP-ribitol ribitolphosphotransferase
MDNVEVLMTRYLKNLISAAVFLLLNRLISIFAPVDSMKVFFVSDVRGEMGGNLGCVWDWLEGRGFRRAAYLKADRRIVSSPAKFLRLVYDWTTSGTILLEDYFRYTSYCRVREGQKIFQLWHGAGAFKKFGYSRSGGSESIRIHKGYRKYAGAVVSAESIRGCYAEAFGIDVSKVRAVGVPRTDIFFDETAREETLKRLYAKYPVMAERKVVLFAPTYRGLRADDAGYDMSRLDLGKMHEALGDEYVFVIKWHPAVYNNIMRGDAGSYDPDAYGEFCLDLSDHRDINELLLAADVLITDYSSVIFDYYFMGKPVIYYAFDRDVYADGRGMYYPYEDYQYGPEVHTQYELAEAILTGSMCEDKRAEFGKRFLSACDGHSTEKCCRWIFEGKI